MIKTGDIFYTETMSYFRITNINTELFYLSAKNKAITVELLDKATFEWELNISFNTLCNWQSKYIGDNLKVVQVLYNNRDKKLN